MKLLERASELYARGEAWSERPGFRGLLALSVAIALVRLLLFASLYSVDVFMRDQWDFLEGFFGGASLVERFRWQHGPHRQGLGNVFLTAVYGVFDFSSRAEATLTAVLMTASALLALRIKRVLLGWSAFDLALPIWVMTITGWETFLATPNPAHGVLAVMLTLVVAWTLVEPGLAGWTRAGALALATYFATFTGFAMFVPVALAPVLVLLWLGQRKALQPLSGWVFSRSQWLALSLAMAWTLYDFARDWRFDPAIDSFSFPAPHPERYIPFVGFMIMRVVMGRVTIGLATTVLASVLAALAIAYALSCARRSLQALRGEAPRAPWPLWPVCFFLFAFSSIFQANTAIGRISVGLDGGLSSRYLPYAVPALLSLWLSAHALPHRARAIIVPLLGLTLFAKELDMGGIVSQLRKDAEDKRAVVACYRETHALFACQQKHSYWLYPGGGEATHLQDKLDWLEQRHASLFADGSSLRAP